MKKLTLTSIREKREKQKSFFEEVKKEMILNGVYYKKAKFQCFNDNMFTYGYSNHSTFFEFTFMCEDTLLDKMTIKELLELKKIVWFDNRIFDKKTREVLGGISFHINDGKEILEPTEEEVKNLNIEYYNENTKGLSEEDLWKGHYIGGGIYLQSDGTYSDLDL